MAVFIFVNHTSIYVTHNVELGDLQMNEGLNNFEGNVLAFDGLVDASGTNFTLIADRNDWPNEFPQYGNNHKLEDAMTNTPIIIIDNNPVPKGQWYSLTSQCGAKSANQSHESSINYVTNIRKGLEQFGASVQNNSSQPKNTALLKALNQHLRTAYQNADSKVIAKYSVEKAVFYHLQNRHTEALNVLRKLNYHRTIPFCLI